MKIAVIHHLLEVIESLEAALRADGEHECVWVAADGRGIAARCKAAPPDVLLVDVTLKSPSAAEITRSVLETRTCSVILVGGRPSSSTGVAYEAMGAGALELLPLPGDDGAARGDAGVLLRRLAKLGRTLPSSTHLRAATANGAVSGPASGHMKSQGLARSPLAQQGVESSRSSAAWKVRAPKLLAIGASTGGPQAIHQLLASLPRPIPCSIAIVQHIDGTFASGMTEWLSGGTGVTVKLAKAGAHLETGSALLAGNEGHLVFTRAGVLAYADEPRDAIHRPSVDVLFSSLARHWPALGVAVLLTGMGRDGAAGLHELRRKGWRTIAQDESTSTVFGMPKAAIQLGAAEQTLPIDAMGSAIGRLLAG